MRSHPRCTQKFPAMMLRELPIREFPQWPSPALPLRDHSLESVTNPRRREGVHLSGTECPGYTQRHLRTGWKEPEHWWEPVARQKARSEAVRGRLSGAFSGRFFSGSREGK